MGEIAYSLAWPRQERLISESSIDSYTRQKVLNWLSAADLADSSMHASTDVPGSQSGTVNSEETFFTGRSDPWTSGDEVTKAKSLGRELESSPLVSDSIKALRVRTAPDPAVSPATALKTTKRLLNPAAAGGEQGPQATQRAHFRGDSCYERPSGPRGRAAGVSPVKSATPTPRLSPLRTARPILPRTCTPPKITAATILASPEFGAPRPRRPLAALIRKRLGTAAAACATCLGLMCLAPTADFADEIGCLDGCVTRADFLEIDDLTAGDADLRRRLLRALRKARAEAAQAQRVHLRRAGSAPL